MLENIYDLLHTWFGEDEAALEEVSQKWWRSDQAFDERLKKRYEPLLGALDEQKLEPWLMQPHGSLAFILLCDQIPRHIYRGQAKAYAYDHHALQACEQGLENEFDKDLTVLEKSFYYLPISHSENINHQNLSLMLYRNLHDESQKEAPSKMGLIANAHEYAQRRYEVITQFGRFPHRNKPLDRKSTEQELKYLSLPQDAK